jgi:hypothetical protein
VVLQGYEYGETADGFIVLRISDGAKFGFLTEDGMLGFDVPASGRPGGKMTVEVIKKG